MAHVIGNYKNIAKTLALRHQLLLLLFATNCKANKMIQSMEKVLLNVNILALQLVIGKSSLIGCLDEKNIILELLTDCTEESMIVV